LNLNGDSAWPVPWRSGQSRVAMSAILLSLPADCPWAISGFTLQATEIGHRCCSVKSG